MSDLSAPPTLTPRKFEFGTEWFVLVEWPAGVKQPVGAFKSEALALTWIADRSAKWLQERPVMLQHA